MRHPHGPKHAATGERIHLNEAGSAGQFHGNHNYASLHVRNLVIGHGQMPGNKPVNVTFQTSHPTLKMKSNSANTCWHAMVDTVMTLRETFALERQGMRSGLHRIRILLSHQIGHHLGGATQLQPKQSRNKLRSVRTLVPIGITRQVNLKELVKAMMLPLVPK